MTTHIHVLQVGAPDPELRTSPIIEESDEEFEVLEQAVPESDACFFNGSAYAAGQYVCSGSELLRCEGGAWVREGSCDPDHP